MGNSPTTHQPLSSAEKRRVKKIRKENALLAGDDGGDAKGPRKEGSPSEAEARDRLLLKAVAEQSPANKTRAATGAGSAAAKTTAGGAKRSLGTTPATGGNGKSAGTPGSTQKSAKRKSPEQKAAKAERKLQKQWSSHDAWVEAPNSLLAFSVAPGVDLETVLETAVEFCPYLPPRTKLWVTLSPGAGNAQTATLFRRVAFIFGGHTDEEWMEAIRSLGLGAATSAAAGYALLFVAHVMATKNRAPDGFEPSLFAATGTPLKSNRKLNVDGFVGAPGTPPPNRKLDLDVNAIDDACERTRAAEAMLANVSVKELKRLAKKAQESGDLATAIKLYERIAELKLPGGKGSSGESIELKKKPVSTAQEVTAQRVKLLEAKVARAERNGDFASATRLMEELDALEEHDGGGKAGRQHVQGKRKDSEEPDSERERLKTKLKRQVGGGDFMGAAETAKSLASHSEPVQDAKDVVSTAQLLELFKLALSPSKEKLTTDHDVPVEKASGLTGDGVGGDDLFQRGTIPDYLLAKVRLYKYVCYVALFRASSVSSLIGRDKRKTVSIGSGVELSVDRDGEIKDSSCNVVEKMTYGQWDAAARIMEKVIERERPSELAGFRQHQERCRAYHLNYRLTRPSGYLRYDMVVRQLAAQTQSGNNAVPFLWGAMPTRVHESIFAAAKHSSCDLCGSSEHYNDACTPKLQEEMVRLLARRTAGGGPRAGDPPGGGLESRISGAGEELSKGARKREAKRLKAEQLARAGEGNPGAGSPSKRQACHHWNDNECTRGAQCRFKHDVCRKCGGSHRWNSTTCPHYDAEEQAAHKARRAASKAGG